MKVGAVFDTSALLAHVRVERVSAGELIAVVAENGDVTGVPALAVLDALPDLDKDERQLLVRMLTDTAEAEATVILPLSGPDLLDVDRLTSIVGGRGTAQAVLEAHKNGTSLATCRPEDIVDVMHPDDVVQLS
ncbi:hypothetical protein [Allorhizocola rhizosphaerae]|uniref:hypothetical protein n=1 Tax=Allorhizocola rhizosphaerae TaxID=1872709 RepID=UPI000E3C3BFF|nr:hypothetical protein [Allorhizocola rhizosphaerae]